jgi:iron complex outermembrane receptor protein
MQKRFARFLIVTLIALPLAAQDKKQDLATMSLDDLMKVQVTSVSKSRASLARSAAAIFVITQENIRRSGATTVPDLLRMVPGLNVAQIDSSTWAVSARGFDMQFANMMLVLIDGRIVYSPSFSGVVWDAQDLVLEDIDRIEVIRGPGATLWGSNAVNGVINIISKKAAETQGGLVSLIAGGTERVESSVRYGGKAGSKGSYRVFAKYFDRGPSANSAGQSEPDGWHLMHVGFRSDWDFSRADALTVQGDFFDSHQQHPAFLVTSLAPIVSGLQAVGFTPVGGNVLGRWRHTFSPRSESTLQVYFDESNRHQTFVSEHRHTTDIDFQHHLEIGGRNDVVWGFGYRYEEDNLPGSVSLSFTPVATRHNRFNSFVQDEITLVPNHLRITAGTRFEDNPYSGFNVQPDFRVLWSPSDHQTIWGAISRPVRTPARSDAGARFLEAASPGPGGVPITVSVYGSPSMQNENLLSYQVGYRSQISSTVSLDLNGYYSRYSQLRAAEPGAPFLESDPAPPHIAIPLIFQNAMAGTTNGVEFGASWQATSKWKLAGGYTWLNMSIRDLVTGDPTNVAGVAGTNPHHQFNLRSYMNLPYGLEWDASAYYVGALPSYAIANYTRVDTRLGWHVSERGEISIVGQNLLSPRHTEFPSSGYSIATLARRRIYGKFTWRF